MIEKMADDMSAWAAARGLSYLGERELPPQTTFLRYGLGVGEHRSSLVTTGGDLWNVQKGWLKKRPERATLNLCRGSLPGGLDGAIGHHVYLTDHGRGHSDGRYQAYIGTVVFAELPVGARASFNLEVNRVADLKTGFYIGKGKPRETGDPLETVVPIPTGRLPIGGFELTTWPEESEARMQAIATPEVRDALAMLPNETKVECESGRLCVFIRGRAVTDGQQLDALCRLASGLAKGMADVVDAEPPLDPGQRLPEPPETKRTKWLREGAGLVDWPTMPESVVAAQQAYRPVVKKKATRTGWWTYGVASIALLFLTLLSAAGWLLGSWLWGTPIVGVIGACFIVLGGIKMSNREGLKIGQTAMDDRVEACARPWGIEAFTREYAKHSGLTVEDPDELRRRLPLSTPGRPQMAWHGDLGGGVHGHLSVWLDPTPSPAPPRFRVVAALGGKVDLGDSFAVEEADGFRVVSKEVDLIGRRADRLDDFRGQVTGNQRVTRNEARRLAERVPSAAMATALSR